MSAIVLSGDTSGAITLIVPSVAGTNTVTIPAVTGTAVISGQNSAITAGTAITTTSGTTASFALIPSWVKRITFLLNGVSTNGTSSFLIQIGSGSYTTSGYSSSVGFITNASSVGAGTATNGFIIAGLASNTDAISGIMTLCNVSGNIWAYSGVLHRTGGSAGTGYCSAVPMSLSGVLDRVQLTTSSADTFDAGSINILYE